MRRFCDWETFLEKHDLLWSQPPKDWKEGAFLGNGRLGIQVYIKEENTLHIELGRNDIYDNRQGDMSGNGICFLTPRLPIGSFDLKMKGEIISFQMRLSLYHAVLNGKIETTAGMIAFEMLVHTEEMLILTQYESTEGELPSEFLFTPGKAVSPRHQYGLDRNQEFRLCRNYRYYEKAIVEEKSDQGSSVQNLSDDLQTVVAWKREKTDKSRRLFVHIGKGYRAENILETCKEYVRKAWDYEKLKRTHLAWWAAYYPQSFVSVPNKRYESFYWIQMYKFACATRADRAVIDNQGPWLAETPWPATWWNLNVQLSYLPLYTANRLELSKSLSGSLLKYRDNLIANVPPEYQYDSAGINTISAENLRSGTVAVPGTKPCNGFRELGNLTWVMHDCWLYYRMTLDKEYLKEIVYPILRRCVNYYLHFVVKGEDGRYHLPATASPEYGMDTRDCNYDLALFVWGCRTLLETVEKLHICDDKIPVWKDIVENVTDYPVDEHGFRIGKDVAYTYSHRHFSHLMMIYPLFLLDAEDDAKSLPLMKKSIEWWWSKPEHMAGFSCTVGSLLWSALKDGDRALHYLDLLWDGKLLPNTLYMEDGPVIETPLSGAQSIHEFLLQSQNGKIRLFPAMPKRWKDACFQNLCAQGGFLVSAFYQEGQIKWIHIKSIAGEPCIVSTKQLQELDLSDKRIMKVSQDSMEVILRQGEEIEIRRRGFGQEIEVRSCGYSEEQEYRYGKMQ